MKQRSTISGNRTDLGKKSTGGDGSHARPFRGFLIGAGLAVALGVLSAMRRGASRGRSGGRGAFGAMLEGSGRGSSQAGSREAKKKVLLAWLNDAYAMEKSLAQTLKHHAHDARNHPVMRARLERHLEETRRHAELVRGCIERLDGHVSTLKSSMSALMGTVQGAATGPAKDELVKNILADSAAERLEIASYQGLITAADEIGDIDTARVCRQILREEEAMSDWLEQQLPSAIREQMAQA